MEEIEEVIKCVFTDKPVGKYHEVERLWEILFRLDVVSDNELPDFLSDISLSKTQEVEGEEVPAEQKQPENPFSTFISGFRQSMEKIGEFTTSKEGKGLLSSLPSGMGENIECVIQDFASSKSDNPLADLFKSFSGSE
jgi:hypothetical protein